MKIKSSLFLIFLVTVCFSEEIPDAPPQEQALPSTNSTKLEETPDTPPQEQTLPSTNRTKLNDSFSYFRLGGFTIGVEAAFGHRFRSERYGWGPNINIAVSPLLLPSILINYEILFYPKRWKNGYWGFMPGIGLGRISTSSRTISTVDGRIIDISEKSEKKWYLWGGFELIFGKEFCKHEKRCFHQLSIGLLYIGYNYGWAF